jgi:dynein heavy chain 2
MVDLYQQVKTKFTVDEFRHYLFTPRDLTSWVKGLLRYDLEGDELLDCLVYEGERQFRDRLVDGDAINKFNGILAGIMRSNWRHNANLDGIYFSSLMQDSSGKEEAKGGDDKDEGESLSKLARSKIDDFKGVISLQLTLYEREEKELNMLLFTEILDHVARVDRVISQDGGHILLVGKTGVGRRSAVTLACYLHRMTMSTPNVTRGYGLQQFKNDLKVVMQQAGIDGEKVCFYLEDHQFTDDTILETVNSLLSAGDVPGLYSHEELEPMLAPLKELMMDEGGFRTPYDFFVSRVKKNLHVCLSMDSTNKKFTTQCESNPAVYTSCSLLWMGDWSRNSLRTVPLMLEGVRDLVKGEGIDFTIEDSPSKKRVKAMQDDDGDDNDEEGGSRGEGKSSRGEGKGARKKEIKKRANFLPTASPEAVVDAIVSIHASCVDIGAAPLDYMSFLNTWKSMFDNKKKTLIRDLGHLQGGLDKLAEAKHTVDNMSNNAQKQQKKLKEAQTKADQAMDEITKALAGANDTRRETEELKKDLAEKAQETQLRKSKIEDELSEIQPVLDASKEAVSGIKSENLNEIRSLKTPPAAIADVLSGVLMLLGIEDLSWLRMKKFLGQRGIKEDILNFDASSISNSPIKNQVENLLRSKSNSFDAATIMRTSVAAAPLAAWVKANFRYSGVLEKIKPLTDELNKAEQVLKKSQKRLDDCEAELAQIDEKVAELKADFGARTREAETLRFGLETAQLTLEGAQKLLGQLGGEQGRWQTQADFLTSQIASLPVYMLLCSGFVVYLSKSSENVREKMISNWLDTVSSVNKIAEFNFRAMLSSESELLVWKQWGLPSDKLSQENGIVVSNLGVEKVPFIIDPAEVSTAWLKKFLGGQSKTGMEVVASGDPRFTSQVELCVRFGKTLLILDVDGVDSMLYPLARRDLQHEGARWVVRVGDKLLDFAETFRMCLVTRNPQPNLPPDAASMVNEINFTITKSGLEGQLLGVVLHHEQPELEKQKSEMLKQEEDYKVELAGLEKNLLEALSTAEGDLLQNTALIDTLSNTKTAAAKIAAALEESGKASQELDRQREVYRDFAKDGSRLFFLIEQLQAVNPMYQFSLASFIGLFKATLSDPQNSSEDVKKRLGKLSPAMDIRALYFVGRALFKADRPTFALHLVHGMKPESFEENEWEAFVGSLVSTNDKPRDFPGWAASERKRQFSMLAENFPSLIDSLDIGGSSWTRWASSAECELEFPNLRGVTPFEKVLWIQAMRPDRLMTAINNFCCDEMRVENLAPPAQSLEQIWKDESTEETPLMLITMPGADPSKELEEFAKKTVGKDRYKSLAIGGGQEEKALEMLRSAAINGDWLCLKNLHLVVGWLGTLEKELNVLQRKEGFRLWLTTEPHTKFPPILLQTSLKITYEAPPGIKKNMERTYSTWSPDFIAQGSERRSQLLFLLAFFHAVIQERRNFVPQGWTKMYEFSTGDLRAGTFALGAVEDGKDDWEMIHGLIMDSIYGGRVDNHFDNRVLKTYLDKYFCDKMVGNGGGKSGSLMKGVSVPQSTNIGDYMDAIMKIPEVDSPGVFSLPDNIERSVQRARSGVVIEQLGLMKSAASGTKGFDKEVWRGSLGPLIELWEKLMEGSDGILRDKKVSTTSPDKKRRGDDDSDRRKGKEEDPVDAFVEMEFDFGCELVAMVNNALIQLKKIMYGSGLLTPEALSIAGDLIRGTIPRSWEKKFEGPAKPMAYCTALVNKTSSLRSWKSPAYGGRGE